MDKRKEKSKEAIRQALIRQSRTKPYSEISVRELCREAHVSRSTFYNNYRFFNDVVDEMSGAYMKKMREKKLTRAFFDSLQHDSDELNLLLESGVFGRDFCLYLRDLIAPGIQPDPTNIELNVEILYHAFGIFGVLQNLLAIRAEPELTGEIYRTGIDKLLKIVGDYAEYTV